MSVEMVTDASGPSSGATAQPTFMQVPKSPKTKKKIKTTAPLVIGSVKAVVPIVMPEVTPVLYESKSAPSSPNDRRKPGKGLLKHLPRPHRGRHRHSREGGEHSNHRPKWLHFRGRKKSRSAEEVNGDTGPAATTLEDSYNLELSLSSLSIEPEATPVADLPGQPCWQLAGSNSDIPTITVSHSSDDHNCEYGNGTVVGEDEIVRKMSQSSHCSTQGTSGLGSYLSPSGDDFSDVESPLSPMSLGSSASFQSSSSDVDARLSDFIEKDLPSPGSDPEASLGITTPPTPHDSPTPDGVGSPVTSPSPPVGSPANPSVFDSPINSPVGSPRGADPLSILEKIRPSSSLVSNVGVRRKDEKKKKDNRLSKPWERWERVKKVVQAWSPFAMQFQKKKYPWVQLAGHQGNFAPGEESGTIQKKSDKNERIALKALMSDELRSFVPEFKREFERDGAMFVEMTDLLREFDEPAVMDIKLGIRTYLEDELVKARVKKTLRKDMYEKMIAIDPSEPTAEEHAQGAITKPRYMQWRESMSSTSTLGFRIEGIKTSEGKALKDFKTIRTREDVLAALRTYLSEVPRLKDPFLRRLLDIREALQRSEFFRAHEVIGSSLLFVCDSSGRSSINIIDFGKTVALPPGLSINHYSPWEEGNHEDGYLWGLNNLIELWKEL